jgi:plasmid stability protein
MEEGHTNPLEAMDPEALRRLELRAAAHFRSVEGEAAHILTRATESADTSAGAAFRGLREKYGTFEGFDIPSRTDSPERWVDFSE